MNSGSVKHVEFRIILEASCMNLIQDGKVNFSWDQLAFQGWRKILAQNFVCQ